TAVEPLSSPQWFVSVNDPERSLAAPAIEAVRSGRIRLIPEGWTNNYFGWMNNLQDWCVSRQIWWGHRIPVWYCAACDPAVIPIRTAGVEPSYTIGRTARPILPDRADAHTNPSRCPACGGTRLIQDPDVLDTWFSSALWPFSTLGWPERTPDLARFYPTAALVTSFDILFFWVARMIMMGLKFMGDVPFRDVYIHALVRDADGQKMSKSKGNVIDPLGIMEQYGTDALRFTLAAMASPGRDVKLSEQRIEGYRNFANKLWNASRFVLMNTEGRPTQDDSTKRSLADHWITARLNRCINTVRQDLEAYRFDEAANHLYHFIWHEFCDWYIELAKPRLAAEAPDDEAAVTRATILTTLETTLRLLHPFMPFITEEIWQKLPHAGDTIVRAPYPKAASITREDEALEGIMADVIEVIGAIRTVRSELNVQPIQKLRAGLRMSEPQADVLRRHGQQDILRLARLAEFHTGPDVVIPPGAVVSSTSLGELFIVLEGLNLEKERARLKKNRDTADGELARLDAKLANPAFTAKAPAEVVADHERRRSELREQVTILADQIHRLEGGA
ncbi:MAG: class I tRNA ligase family protein, partial [Nitrospiria bacterium]